MSKKPPTTRPKEFTAGRFCLSGVGIVFPALSFALKESRPNQPLNLDRQSVTPQDGGCAG
jgi:hypothetical protein